MYQDDEADWVTSDGEAEFREMMQVTRSIAGQVLRVKPVKLKKSRLRKVARMPTLHITRP